MACKHILIIHITLTFTLTALYSGPWLLLSTINLFASIAKSVLTVQVLNF